ncbi:MAG: hypothetical protein KF853_15850 [Rhodocyclaceae bacterium]|nr:hypothetical protein [Rhodocyclaceae bacterium]
MERKPYEPAVAVKAKMIGGVPYVEARYLQECVAEIARLKDALADATDCHKIQYAQGPVGVNVRPLAWRRVSNICGEVHGVFETQDVELRSERLEPLFGVAAIESATYDAAVRALDEAGIRNEVLRGMCIEVAIEKLRDVLRPNAGVTGAELAKRPR